MNQIAPTPAPARHGAFPVGFPPAAETLHIGIDDMPWVPLGEGLELQLLHVDLNAGLWINRTRMKPGTSVSTHFHTGMVLAVTLEGRWFYKESPEQVNSAGSYLFEPAASVHTLQAAADQEGPTITWFAIWGANVNIAPDGQVLSVLDAAAILTIYRNACAQMKLDCSKLVVIGAA